jgi:membrane protease subunit HflC
MTPRQIAGLALAFIVLFVVVDSAFNVDQREKVVVTRFGRLIGSKYEPGLHLKVPVIDKVFRFDARILRLDNKEEIFYSSESKSVVVDFFVKWRVNDVRKYYLTTKGDERVALERLEKIVNGGLRDEFSSRTVQDAIANERSEIMRKLAQQANAQVQDLGVEIIDVRVKRIDYPEAVSDSVYSRMKSERQRVAHELRGKGDEAAERIRADADRQREVILAEAYREAERTRGEGDALAAEIYAKAYGKNPDFYAFYRSLNVYQNTWRNKTDVLVLEPDGEFFRYFNPPATPAR